MSFIRQIKRNGRVYNIGVENKCDGAKVKQKFIRYIGVSPEKKSPLFPSNFDELSLGSSRLSGSIISLDGLSQQLGLYEILGPHMPTLF